MCEDDDDDDDGVTENGVEWNRRSQSPERQGPVDRRGARRTLNWIYGFAAMTAVWKVEKHTLTAQPGTFSPPRLHTSYPHDDVLITGREVTE